MRAAPGLWRILPALALWLAAAGRPAAAPAQQPEVLELEASGIPVLLERVPNGVVAAQVFIRGGAANLTPQNAGIERLLFEAAGRGTEKYPKELFHARLAGTGTTVSGNAGYDYSTFAMRTVRESWDEAWDLFTQALLKPALPPNEVVLAREQLLNAVRQRRDNPDAYLAELADSLFYAGHPYALNPQGTVAGVDSLDAEALREWHRRRLTKENLLLVVVGDIDPEDLRAKVQAAFGGLPEEGEAGRRAESRGAAPAELAVVQRALPTNYVRGTFPAPGLADEEDYAALSLALSILSDRLFEEVRTKRNLSYAVAAAISSRLANYGVLYVTAIEPDTTLQVMRDEVRRLREEPVSDTTLAHAKNVFETEHYLGLETNDAQAALLGRYELLGGGWEEARDFVDEVREVTAADVQRVMRAYVSGLRFVVLGDPAKVDRALFTSM